MRSLTVEMEWMNGPVPAPASCAQSACLGLTASGWTAIIITT